jgi:hypothetical protein
MTYPNVFVAGFPKCGTTSLAYYLSQHPDIFTTRPKELGYYSQSVRLNHKVPCPHYKTYLKKYSSARYTKIIVDTDPLVIYNARSIGQIYAHNPHAQFIIVIRNPIDAAISLHGQHLKDPRNKMEFDFESAWKNAVVDCKMPLRENCYPKMYLYSEYVSNLLSLFDRDQVTFIKFDDFITDAVSVYNIILKFLNLDIGKLSLKIESYNPRGYRESNWHSRWLHSIAERTISLRARLGISSIGLLNKLSPIKELPKPKLSESFSQELKDYFRVDLIRFSKITGIDFSSWIL